MLVFVIPLKSRVASKSWETVSNLLERTLQSVCNQTSPDFQVIVVCHDRPNLQHNYPKVEFLDVNFTPPSRLTPSSGMADQERKLRIGADHASTIAPASHLMFVDADDCVSSNLAEFVKQHQHCHGWFLDQGYEYQDGNPRLKHRKQGFSKICGTSNIVRADLIHQYIEDLQLLETRFAEKRLFHTEIAKAMQARATPLSPLPFPGAVYITDNSENLENQSTLVLQQIRSQPVKLTKFYAMKLYKRLAAQPLTHALQQEFKLYSIAAIGSAQRITTDPRVQQ
ncbi:glycosyltransferase family 2 protein [Leptolyngbya sp. DQ-M1]|uniref:glycosyltransferase family A protein n=1 Tax=Leptolyngbya sp. DQ-M1 TaxID=2933920 RepID=UPI0032969CC9